MVRKPNLPPHLKLPFKVEYHLPFKPLHEERDERQKTETNQEFMLRQEAWLEDIKKQARDNLDRDVERLRISWTNRYNRPRHDRYEDYTMEEILLETWEQHYFENPNSLELKGISKKVNPRTKYSYYVTGDPVIDGLEQEFAEGRTPDLEKAFGHIKNGPDIFRSPIFQGRGGQPVVPIQRPEVVKKNEKGEKITEAGTRVEHDDFRSDQWVRDALDDDPVLKAMAAKLQKVTDAKV